MFDIWHLVGFACMAGGLALLLGAGIGYYAAAEIERLRGEVEWDHRGIPIYEDGSEAVGRSIDACRELVEADANPDHWINKERNYDLPAFVAFRTERRRRGTDGPWEPTPEGENDND